MYVATWITSNKPVPQNSELYMCNLRHIPMPIFGAVPQHIHVRANTSDHFYSYRCAPFYAVDVCRVRFHYFSERTLANQNVCNISWTPALLLHVCMQSHETPLQVHQIVLLRYVKYEA